MQVNEEEVRPTWADVDDYNVGDRAPQDVIKFLRDKEAEAYGAPLAEPAKEAAELLALWQADNDLDVKEDGAEPIDWHAEYKRAALAEGDEAPQMMSGPAALECAEHMNDAEILGTDHPDMSEMLAKSFTFMTGDLYGQRDRRNTQDGDWKAVTAPLINWMVGSEGKNGKGAWGLTRHPVGREKGGPSIVPSFNLDGARKDAAVETMYAIVLDIDSGESLDDTIDKLIDKNLFAIVYTTFSHGKTEVELKHDDIMRKLGLEDSPSRTQIQEYLRLHHSGRYDRDFIAQIEVVDARRQTPNGMLTVIKTPAIDKFRVVLPLWEPVKLADLAPTLQKWKDFWADAVTGVAVNILDVNFDSSSTDVNRLFYTPRHPKGDDNWYSAVIQGRPLRFEEIKPYSKEKFLRSRTAPGDPFLVGTDGDKPGVPLCMAPSGMVLNEWHRDAKERFMIADVLETYCQDKLADAENKAGSVHIQCPFEHEHSSTGGSGTLAVNALDSDSEYWTIFCLHDSCKGRHKLEFLQQMLADEWFPESILKDSSFLLPPADGAASELVSLTADAVAALIEGAGINHDTSESALRKFLTAHLDVDVTTRAAMIEALSTSRGSPGATKLKPSQLEKIWTDLVTERAKEAHEEEVQKRAGRKAPGYVPAEEATEESVLKAAEAAKHLPSNFACDGGWFKAFDAETVNGSGKPVYKPVCRAFEVVCMADGTKGTSRTNQVTIRYRHRAKNMGIVESTFRLGDLYKDSGTILGKLANEGLEFAPGAPTAIVLTLLRSIRSDREAVYTDRSGWITPERDVYVSPTGEVVKTEGDKKLYVLDQTRRVSAQKAGTLDDAIAAADAALRGRNARRFLPGFMLGAVGCLADFLGEELSVILMNIGKAKHGKSTALKAGVSWFCIPNSDGLLISGRMSATAMEIMAAKGTGACFAPDESGASKLTAAEEQEIILLYAGGIGAARGTPDAGIRDFNTWSGAMGLSTENDPIARMNAEGVDVRAGAVSRVVTVNYDGAPKLDASEDAEELAAYQVLAHGGAYGVLGPAFAAKLVQLGKEDVRGRVAAQVAKWGAGHSGAAERVVRTVALFAVAVEVAQESGLLPSSDNIDLEAMLCDLLEETIAQRADHLDTERQALNSLRRAIIAAVNGEQIANAGTGGDRYAETLGYYKDGKTARNAPVPAEDTEDDFTVLEARIYILPVDRLAKLGCKTDLSALVAGLKDVGALVESSGKYAKQGLWETIPQEGKGKNVRLYGWWVHGLSAPVGGAAEENDE